MTIVLVVRGAMIQESAGVHAIGRLGLGSRLGADRIFGCRGPPRGSLRGRPNSQSMAHSRPCIALAAHPADELRAFELARSIASHGESCELRLLPRLLAKSVGSSKSDLVPAPLLGNGNEIADDFGILQSESKAPAAVREREIAVREMVLVADFDVAGADVLGNRARVCRCGARSLAEPWLPFVDGGIRRFRARRARIVFSFWAAASSRILAGLLSANSGRSEFSSARGPSNSRAFPLARCRFLDSGFLGHDDLLSSYRRASRKWLTSASSSLSVGRSPACSNVRLLQALAKIFDRERLQLLDILKVCNVSKASSAVACGSPPSAARRPRRAGAAAVAVSARRRYGCALARNGVACRGGGSNRARKRRSA